MTYCEDIITNASSDGDPPASSQYKPVYKAFSERDGRRSSKSWLEIETRASKASSWREDTVPCHSGTVYQVNLQLEHKRDAQALHKAGLGPGCRAVRSRLRAVEVLSASFVPTSTGSHLDLLVYAHT